MSIALRFAAFSSLLVAAFAYGIVSARHDLFPHGFVRSFLPREETSPSLGANDASGGEGTATQQSSIDYAAVVGRAQDPDLAWPAETERGMFHRAPEWVDGAPSTAVRNAQEVIADTPYLGGVEPAPARHGVTRYDPDLAFDGLNLVLSAHAAEATLRDMKGNVVHHWSFPMQGAWPEPLGFQEWEAHKTFWRRVHVFPNGDLLAIYEGIGMIKIDRDSRLIWSHKGRCHHDVAVAEDGRIYTLARHAVEASELGRPILEDFILVLDSDGQELQRLSILDAFRASPHAEHLRRLPPIPDAFHTNTIELLDDRLKDRIPAFRRGSVLISVRNIDTLAVVDLTGETVTWTLTGMWRRQHQPTVLDNGNLLLFDNSGHRGESQVIELDPATHEVAWVYRGSESEPFDSWHSGSTQRLPNGNTLISESVSGRAFEVTSQGEIVWEFINPHRAGLEKKLIAVLSEVVRFGWDDLRFDAVEAARQARQGSVDAADVERLLQRGKK